MFRKHLSWHYLPEKCLNKKQFIAEWHKAVASNIDPQTCQHMIGWKEVASGIHFCQ